MVNSIWVPRTPSLGTPPVERPPAFPVDDPTWRDVLVRDQRLTPTEEYDDPELTDVVLDNCDVAGFVATSGRATGLRLQGGRIRGVTWARGLFRDVLADGVTAEDVSLRFGTLRRVEFRDCSLPGFDLTETTGEHVRFLRCDLTRAKFDHARIGRLRISGCDLAGATGVEALRGASVHPDDVASMATSLARAVGIRIADDDA